MGLESDAIDEYCAGHSSAVSPECREIERYTRANIPMSVMLVGPLEASFLGFLVGLIGAKRVLEVGCYTGYSALAMAEKLPADGELITIDRDEKTSALARDFWKKSPHGGKIKLMVGNGLTVLDKLSGPFDFVFLDASKAEYLDYLTRTLSLLSEKGMIAADNCLQGGQVLNPETKEGSVRAIQRFNDYVRSRSDLECVLLPLRDGVMLVQRRKS